MHPCTDTDCAASGVQQVSNAGGGFDEDEDEDTEKVKFVSGFLCQDAF